MIQVASDHRDRGDMVRSATRGLREQVGVRLDGNDVPDIGGKEREIQAVACPDLEHDPGQAGEEGEAVLTHAAILEAA